MKTEILEEKLTFYSFDNFEIIGCQEASDNCILCKIQPTTERYEIPLKQNGKDVILYCGTATYKLFKELEEKTGVETSKMELIINQDSFQEQSHVTISCNDEKFKLFLEGLKKIPRIIKVKK